MNNRFDFEYKNMIREVLGGQDVQDRTGVGTKSCFGKTIEIDHREDGFPLLTLKYTNFKAIVAELLWFIKGSDNINDLDSKIWDEWADANGNVGPIYGVQWRRWPSYCHCDGIKRVSSEHDQLKSTIENIKLYPRSRRHLISAWNVSALDDMALPPCHYAMQFYVEADESLSIMVHQRSADLMLGVPFNMASYSLLLMMVSQCVDRKPGRHIHTFGDYHIYNNHLDAAQQCLIRPKFSSPTVRLESITNIDDFKQEHISLIDYLHHDAIKLPVAV